MDRERLRALLEEVRAGRASIDDALAQVHHLPFEDLGFARVDGHRAVRKGFPEVVFCQGKRTEQVVDIVERLARHHARVLATRASLEVYEAVRQRIPHARWHDDARLIAVGEDPAPRTKRSVVVATGGTADIPVAREAEITARWIGVPVVTLFDVGVAGIHRLLHHLDLLREASAIVAVAGMEGALPGVLAGLVDCPVIGVPTSVGYGAHFGGVAPLLTMLNSCATGVAVVNIDNGFGAGVMAAIIGLAGERDSQVKSPSVGEGRQAP